MRVPWLSKDRIAEKAEGLISDYQIETGEKITPPIPVNRVIEKYLKLKLGTVDFENRFGMRGVLGATYVQAGVILIDESLSRNHGRAQFTCAHEVGHWVLHRQYVEEAQRTGDLGEAIICRTAMAKEPIEWQADYFAGCLLMPEGDVIEAFDKVCDGEALVLHNVRSSLGGTAVCVDPCVQNWHFIANVVREVGGFTNVSKEAMIIRLQELGLIINLTGVHIGWNSSVRAA